MPRSGSQIIICDVPIRFDTYKGCSHACSYCFARAKTDISKIYTDESAENLKNFIKGQRSRETQWCDFRLPLHWGGMSDPFQPVERTTGRSLECLKVFAETQYPFIVSTKSALLIEEPYLSLIKKCNCVVQFSAACSKYDKIETGAATFKERVHAASILSKYVRVNIRIQPYIPEYYTDIRDSMKIFADAGVHGVIVESMKYKKKINSKLIHVGGDFVYPSSLLLRQYTVLKNIAHQHGMKFYCGENRLRNFGDELCCCGVEGMGWQTFTGNMNHFLFDRENYKFTDAMKEIYSGYVFKALGQTHEHDILLRKSTFEEVMHTYEKKAQSLLTPFDLKEELKKKK